ncbi:hypothetical protein CTAYLR_000246 [Chrysophaeum taylorii]|uniref:Carboxylic ester hydrolase n=1 Tax=Chrysophaeum taylorii TaxID=2483200 RepID=A0AAD7XL40_9STRA|nr:hypothetical protein CTAYLR_000246 [Chrysophaeum taylorii]
MKVGIVVGLVVASAEEIVVSIGNGKILGRVEAGVAGFWGVPYAVPPIMGRRFKVPEPHQNWTGIRDATTAAPECVQSDGGSEDCLILNAFARTSGLSPTTTKKSAVLFLIHGGGFVGGSARLDAFNMSRQTGLVVVAPQYRLGVFGFLCNERSDDGGCFNFGLLDQRLALVWTVQNAHVFGGDSSRILLMGGSAGGASVAGMLVANDSTLTFAAATLESPGGHQGWMGGDKRSDDDWMSNALKINHTARLFNLLNASSVDDMADLPTEMIYFYAKALRFAPSLVDENGNDDYPLHRIRTGRWTRVPVIVGGVSCESCEKAVDYLGEPRDNVTREEFLNSLASYFDDGALVAPLELEAWYAHRIETEGRWRTFARILSDSGHACSTALHAEAFAQGGAPVVWRYFFAYTEDDDSLPGATHGSDETYILDLETPDLSAKMAAWWASMAKFADPNNGTSAPGWRAYDPPDHRLVMYMGLDHDPNPRLNESLDTVRPECANWEPYLGW